MQIKDRIVGLRRVKARDLIPNEKNWRKHPEPQQQAIRGILQEVGYVDALLARETPNGLELIDGHLRASVTPDEEVPVLIVDLSDEEAAKVLATFDPLAAMAETDAAALDKLLREVETGDAAIADLLTDLANDAGLYDVSDDDEGESAGSDTEVLLDQAIQLTPPKEYIVVMCDTDEDYERLKIALELKPVRRGGYKRGSAFDAVGVQRVVRAADLLERLSADSDTEQGKM